ncbi:MAG: nuclear transport factor 2 family protein, partial [Bacteroidota bacterium]
SLIYHLLLEKKNLYESRTQKNASMKERHQELIEFYIHAYNHFDVEGMIRMLDDQVVFENISNGEITLQTVGINAFQEQAESAKSYFSKRKQTISTWKFEQEKVTVEIDYEAVLAMDFPNGMKAGDTLKMKGRSEFFLQGEKIVKIRDIS